MKPICCDTSFLLALYGANAHTDKALTILRGQSLPLTLSLLNLFEMENALRFFCWRKLFSAVQAEECLAAFEADRRSGRLVVANANLAMVIEEARRISALATIRGGHRSFDILHVAAALIVGADKFFSFDTNQRKLARAEGFRLNA